MNNQLEACDNSTEINRELNYLEAQLQELNEEVYQLYYDFHRVLSNEVSCAKNSEENKISQSSLSPLGSQLKEMNEIIKNIRNKLEDIHNRCML